MTNTSTWSTTAEKFAPGNFVETWNPDLGRNAVGVTRAVENTQEANPRILVKWTHDLTQEWVRAEYLRRLNR
jgi:G:T-mismatch repair DNA endonuclease (very short patch repair protein)